MSLSTSNELFINLKSIPDPESVEYDDFFENERKKIEYGITINGVHITGWLYWHINHWFIYKDELDPINHMVRDVYGNPDFRDNEWIIAENIQKAEEQQKGLMVFGSRRMAKTVFASSYIARSAIVYEGSQNVVSGGNWVDIDNITSILDKGLNAVHPYFRFGKLGDNWRKEVGLGFKIKEKGSWVRSEWSKILMRNHDNGNNPEVAAGIKAKSFLCDEVGKSKFLQFFEASKPCFTSPFGWRTSPILTGTSGLIEPDSDAEKVFLNPEAFNFLTLELKEEGGKKVSLFIPGYRRMETKYETTFGEFIEKDKGIILPDDSELKNLKFFNSDIEAGKALCLKEQEDAKKSKDPASLLKAKMYYPLNTDDLFITLSDNRFNTEAIGEWLTYLEKHKDENEKYIELYRDVDNKVVAKASHKNPVESFPVDPTADNDAPIIVYEDPMPNAPTLLYIAGLDPYNVSESANSDSLGSCVIYKRMYDPIGGTYQQMIVASYDGRAKSLKEFYKIVENLLDYYNATCMMESADQGFLQHMDNKNKAYILADGFSLVREVTPNTSIRGRIKGLPATVGIIRHCMNLLYSYLDEEITIGQKDNEPIIKLGLIRIKHRFLLKQMLNYKEGANVDTIVSFRHVLAYDHHLEKNNPIVHVSGEEVPELKIPSSYSSPFAMNKMNPFGGTGKATNLFK